METPAHGAAKLARRLAILAVALATLFGGGLRFYGLGTPGLWLDEILMYDFATRSAAQPWHAWLTGFEFENGPLYLGSLLLGRVVPGVHTPEESDRWAAAVAGTLTIPLVAIAGALAAGPVAGVAAAWLFAVAPFHVYYSREGRTYAILTLLATLALLAFLARRRQSSVWLGWVAIAAPYLAVSAFQVLAGMVLTAGACAILDRRGEAAPAGDRRRWLRLAATGAAGLALYGLLYGRYPRGPQIGNFPPRRAQLVVDILNAFAASPLWRIWGISRLTPVYAAAALLGLGFLLVRDRVRAAILGGFLFSICTLVWLSLELTNHFFTLRYFTPALPADLILAAVGIAALARAVAWGIARAQRAPASRWVAPGLAAALVLALVVGNVGNALACPFVKADWQGAARFLAVRGGPGEPVLAADGWTRTCLNFYLRSHSRWRGSLYVLPSSAAAADALVAKLGRSWVVRGGYLIGRPQRQWIRQLSPAWTSRAERIAVYEVSPHPR